MMRQKGLITLSFVEWYEDSYGEKWHPDYAELQGFALELIEKYDRYCSREEIKPIYNG